MNKRQALRLLFAGLYGRHRALTLLPLLVVLIVFGTAATLADEAGRNGESDNRISRADGQPRRWALLIGIEKYHRANRLRYTVNDVRQLSLSLHRRGDYKQSDILEIVDSAPNPRFQPLRASLRAELPAFLAKPGPKDHILVYFSGHGFRDKQGKLYLAPIDCDPADAAVSGIAVEWFREQLAGCKAKTKLLVIDACHAGSEKGDDDTPSVAAKDLGTVFRDLEGVVTLASSTSDQKSLIWEEKEQSLFSFWLNQGIKGHADNDSDGIVTIDELYDYVYRNVTHTAKARFPRAQTPVRIVRAGTLGVPEVIRLQPQSVKQILADMAEQLAWAMEERQLSKVGVLEFTNDTKLGELLGADFGLLGRYFAEELERRLMTLGSDKFSVVDRRRLQAALNKQDFGLKDLASTSAMQRLSQRAGGMPVIALGTLRNRAGRIVSLQCKLLQTERDELAGVAGGTAVLNESEWAMLGRSVQVQDRDRRPEFAPTDRPAENLDDLVIRRLDRRSQGSHPLLDPYFPYRVSIMVKERAGREPVERKGVFRNNEMFIPLSKGEVYQIRVENHSDQHVLLRLLVDGLNTLPEKEQTTTKMMTVEPVNKAARYLPAQRVNLSEAEAWLLDPTPSGEEAPVTDYQGFYTATGSEGGYREFKVVDAQQSVAARQNFTDQLGLITAAFYAPKSQSRRIGTGLGQQQSEAVEEVKGFVPGNLLGIVHIRYVEPEVLKKMNK